MTFQELPYSRPDCEKMTQQIREDMSSFARAKSYDEARALFFNRERIIDSFSKMSTIARIRNTTDTRDEFYKKEMEFFYEEEPKLELLLKDANRLLLDSPFRANFEREFGEDFMKGIEASLKLSDDSVLNEKIEESKLCQAYSSLTAESTAPFQGEECNFYKLLKGMLSPKREIRKEAFLAWAGLYEKISLKLDEIYDQLVRIRKNMAKKLGFKSYVDMAYLINGHYYYGAEEIASFRKQVVDVVVPVANELFQRQSDRLNVHPLRYYDEQLCFPEGNATPIGDRDFLVDCAQKMYRELSPQTGEFFDFMVSHQLFDLDSRTGKRLGGYCTFIPELKMPFIFANFNGSSADVDVLTHEAGHAFQAYTAAKYVPLSSLIWSTNEISEIHSMSMEHFAYPYMDKFFGENASKYRFAHLSDTVKSLPYLCLVDHFQHEIFAHDYSARERRQCWKQLEQIYLPWRNYDGCAFLEEGGFWMQKQHIFLSPFYYVDYALAQMGAFEYYARMKKDPKAAWEDYFRLCKTGGSKSYFELLKIGNLSNPFAEGSVAKIISPIAQELLNS